MQTWVTVFHKFERGVGLPLACLFLFGMFFPYKKNVYEWSFLAIVAGFFMYFEAKFISRYIIFVAPLIAIIASNAVFWLIERNRKSLRVAGYFLIIVVSVYSFGHSATGVSMRLDDTRTQAAHYIHNRFPDETTLGITYAPRDGDYKLHRWRNPRINFTKFRDMDIFDYPEVVIVSSLVKLRPIKKALHSDKLSEDFVWDQRYNHKWRWDSPPSPRMFRFYHELFEADRSRYRLVKTFKKKLSVWLEHSSPQMDIYVRQSYGPQMERRVYYPSNPRDYFQEKDMRDWRWQLRVEEGNKAKLKFPSKDLNAIRIAIKKADVGPPWAIQLNQRPVAILNNEAYVLHFRIRADNARLVAVAVGQTSAPWQTVGLYQHVQVTEDWQEYALSFRAEADEPQARVFFDLGESAVSVEIGDVQLRHKSDVVLASLTRSRQGWRSANELIEPDYPDKFYVDYQFNTMGCRGRDYPIPRTSEGTRILVLGDSLALGAGVHQEDTLASQLEGMLNQGRQGTITGPGYEVINCGVEGYGTQEAARFYETFGSTYAPDIVLLVMAPDDDHSLFQERRQKILRSPGSQFVAWSDQQERLFNRSAPDYSGSLKEVANLQQLVEGRGGKLAVVVFRHTQHQAWKPLIQQLTQSFRNTTVQVLDLGETLLASHSEDELIVHEEDKHPNDLAHRIAAQGLRDFLTRKGLLVGQPIARLDATL